MKQRHRKLASVIFILTVALPALTSCSRGSSAVLARVWIEDTSDRVKGVMVFTNRKPARESFSLYHPATGILLRKGSMPCLMVESILGGSPDRVVEPYWLYDISRKGNLDRQQIKMVHVSSGVVSDITYDEKKNIITRYEQTYFPAEQSAAEKIFLRVCGEVADLVVAVRAKPSQEESEKLRRQLDGVYAQLPTIGQLLGPTKRR